METSRKHGKQNIHVRGVPMEDWKWIKQFCLDNDGVTANAFAVAAIKDAVRRCREEEARGD